jgi:hypothetical protein
MFEQLSSRLPGVLLVLGVISYQCPCQAQLVLDQGFDPTGQITVASGIGGINTNQYRAQTFQVGLSGTLGEVDVYMRRFPTSGIGGNMIFEIRRQTASGVPSDVSSDSLLSIPIPSARFSTSLGFLPIDVSSVNLHVSAGDKLAIVFHADVNTPSNVAYQWLGQNNNPYLNGNSLEEVVGNHSWGNEGLPNADLGFETYMFVPVPEPVHIPVYVIGCYLLKLFLFRRKSVCSSIQ